MTTDPIEKTARIISGVFNPLLLPTYGIAAAMTWSVLQYIPLRTRIEAGSIIFILTAVIPFMLIYGLATTKIVKDVTLSDRTDRTIPYGATLLLYIVTAGYLFMARAPHWLAGFMVGASVALAITLIVNRWWKISAHAAGTGGLIAMACVIAILPTTPQPAMWLVITTIMITGLTCTSRLILRCHTPAQIYAGVANGMINVFIWSLI